ncbi:MAG: retention module-containing protein, partial [Methylophaga sp.]
MATEIGIIKALVGTATATATDGTIRNLQVGDKVYQNDLITTGAAGAVEIEFADGSTMDMGRSSQAMLDIEVFDLSTAAIETAATTETTDDIAAIQQALLEGEDPTVAGEATAAGAGAAGEGNEGGHSFVVRDYLNPQTTPENGFDTVGVANSFDNPEELNLIIVDEDEPVIVPPVNQPPTINPPTDPENPPPTGGNDGPQNIISTALVSEAGLSFGSDPESGSATFSGSFFIADPDGIDDIVNISFNGEAPIALGDLIPGLMIPTDLGEITILDFDDTTGEVTFSYELITNIISDPAADDGNNTEFGAEIISVVVTDTVGQQGTGNIVVNVVDDVPFITEGEANLGELSLTTDDVDTPNDTDSANFSAALLAALDVDYGADGAGDTVIDNYSLSVGVDGVSGLFSGDEAIILSVNLDGVVEGRTETGDALVFTVSVDGEGEVTLTQLLAVDHVGEGDDDDAFNNDANLETLLAGSISLNADVTVTDGDGDAVEDSISVDISGAINFTDDVPTVEVGEVELGELSLTTDDADTPNDTDSANFSAALLAA